MSFENWSVLKSDYFNGTEKKSAKEYTKEYVEVARWCNEQGTYTIHDDGEYYRVITLEEMQAMQEALITPEQKAENKRAERDYMLANTDKYMIEDFPINEDGRALYKEYRQYLRDIPNDPDFPEIEILTFEDWID